MTERSWQYTAAASADIEQILDETRQQFGDAQMLRYAALIDRAAGMAGADPMRPSSLDQGPIASGVRSLHAGLAANQRGRAAHVLFYRVRVIRGRTLVEVLRVLHERMDPARHLGSENA